MAFGAKKYEKHAGVAIETFSHISHAEIHTLSTPTLRILGKQGAFQYIVDNAMLSNYHTFGYIASTLHSRIAKHAIEAAFSQQKNELAISFEGSSGALIISCERDINTLYWHDRFSRARANSADVLKSLVGETVTTVEVPGSDRIVTFELASGKTVVAQFFTGQSNVLIIDDDRCIVDSFLKAKRLTGQRFEHRSGEMIYDLVHFDEQVRGIRRPISVGLKTLFPTLGALLANEVLFRANVPSEIGSNALDALQVACIRSALQEVLFDLENPSPRVYFREANGAEEMVAFSILVLHHLQQFRERTFSDVHEAIRYYIFRSRVHGNFREAKSTPLDKLKSFHKKLERSIAAIKSDLEQNSRAAEYQTDGTLLMANSNLVPKGAATAVVTEGGRERVISLDTRLTVIQNAQRYFEKAKHTRLAAEQAAMRLLDLQNQERTLSQLLEHINAIHTSEELKSFMNDNVDVLREFHISPRGETSEDIPFRVFTVEGGFQVLAGKSSANNDLLTMKYAKPNDLWFHARGSSGSHVVLKVGSGKGEPGKRAKEQAAGIAAYYSKMKNAKMVPVAMTEKKYVRKPKGSHAGTVVLDREKVLFVEPALPVNELSGRE